RACRNSAAHGLAGPYASSNARSHPGRGRNAQTITYTATHLAAQEGGLWPLPSQRPRRSAFPGAQKRSSTGLPSGSTGIGRAGPCRYCAWVSTPRWRYSVASTSWGVFGLLLGKAPRLSDAPTTRPPRTGPPARAALKTLG